MSLNADQTVEALRAAGEPTRLRILSLLASEELSVMEMSRILDQSQPRVSRHLKLMTDSGLIERFPDGARVYYRLSHDPHARRLIDTVLDILADDAGEADHRRLSEVQKDRQQAAESYFEQIAPQWTGCAPSMSAKAPWKPHWKGRWGPVRSSASSTWAPARDVC